MDKAVNRWRAGELVIMPTETVYGLGAAASNGKAVAQIFQAKSRPQFNPLIVHVADVETAKRYGEWNDAAEQLAQAFWPGPLTLVLKRRADAMLSRLVTAGGDTVALRVPAHPVAQILLRAYGAGIAAPSANRSGRVSPTRVEHVRSELGDDIALIIDGGPCDIGLESTVIDLSGDAPALLRPGSITRAMLESILGRALATPKTNAQLKSPGQLESHYAPSLPVRLNVEKLEEGEALLAFGPALKGSAREHNLSLTGDLLEAAANLFAHLRALDDPRFTAIAVMPIPHEGIGEAINDRLKRAAVR